MLILKTDPVGIDYMIQQIMAEIHPRIMAAWDLDPEVEIENKLFQFHGRSYRNQTSNGFVAEVYTADNQYKEVYWNDALHGIAFFGTNGTEKHQIAGYETTQVHLVFFVNLDKIKPSITHRADEEVRNEVIKIISEENRDFIFKSNDIWLENVLKEYPGSLREDRLKFVDMHPVHCFRLNFELNYNKSIC